jgi:hypothetical protein
MSFDNNVQRFLARSAKYLLELADEDWLQVGECFKQPLSQAAPALHATALNTGFVFDQRSPQL